MDGEHFDILTRTLTASLSRRVTLIGLMAGVLSALSLTLDEMPVLAKKKDKKKVRVCNCATADVATCTSQKKAKAKATKLLRTNRCAYKGGCTGVSGCATTTPSPPPGPPPPGPVGAACVQNTDCASGKCGCFVGECTCRIAQCAVFNDRCDNIGSRDECCSGYCLDAGGFGECHNQPGGGP